MSEQVIPFGKNKGQPTELMLADRSYCMWLAAQPWFKERFAPIYNIIVHGPSEEHQCTPEHNALQNLFLLKRYPHASNLVKLLRSRTPEHGLDPEKWDFEEEPALAAPVINNRRGEAEGWDVVFDVNDRWIGKWRSKTMRVWKRFGDDWKRFERYDYSDYWSQPACPDWPNVEWRGHPERDPNEVREVPEYGEWETETSSSALTLAIELKPLIGDDYPVVMRKLLRRVKSAGLTRYQDIGRSELIGALPVLVVGDFNSEVTTLEDLRAIFEQHRISVVTLEEIEAAA